MKIHKEDLVQQKHLQKLWKKGEKKKVAESF